MLFDQGSHGFIKTHKWNSTIGAFINIEASGSGGTGIILQLFIMCSCSPYFGFQEILVS
jgi:hypothetical protein